MTQQTKSRVVVTGLGVITGFGADLQSFRSSLMAAQPCIRPIANFDTTDLKTRVAAEIDNKLLDQALATSGSTRSDRATDLAAIAAFHALTQAGLISGPQPEAPIPAATIIGTGVGCSASLLDANASYQSKGIRGIRPTTIPRCMANAIASQLSIRFKLTGANYVLISACSSSTTAIGIAFRMIRDGYAHTVLCGGAEAALDPFVFGSWNNLGVMSKIADPAKACRPFDAARDGCVLGEGAGMLVLESLEQATARQARILAEIAGFGESSDASHITKPSADGQAAAIRMALNDAHVDPAQLGYINAHGTATKANDETEAQSIRLALGTQADRIPVSSHKSLFGHLLGAAGAVETIATILALQDQTIPPAANLDNPDPACAIQLVRATPLPLTLPYALKNSFGFGGNNAVLVLRAAP